MGQDPERFWLITPRLALLEIEAVEERQRRVNNLAITAAWVGAALQRAEKLPALSELIGGNETNKEQDLRMYLGGMKQTLPKITMAEWRGSQAQSLDRE